MKKLVILIIVIVCNSSIVCAVPAEVDEIINATDAQKILESKNDIFPSFDATEFVYDLADGKGVDAESLIEKVLDYFFRSFRKNLKLCLSVVGISYIMGLYSNLQNFGGNGISQIGYMIFYCVLAGVICTAFFGISEATVESIRDISVMIKSLMPILVMLLTTAGAVVSGGLLASVLISIANIVLFVIETFVLPLIYCSFAMSIATNMSDRIKLTKTVPFLHKMVKWVLLFTMIMFSSLFGIYGLSGHAIDATAGKLVRFAIGTSVPLVGGIAADSFETVLSTLSVGRTLIGVGGIAVVFITLLCPFIESAVVMWIFKLCAVVIEPFSDVRTVKLLSDASECITMLFAALISVALIFTGGIGVVLVTGNFVLG